MGMGRLVDTMEAFKEGRFKGIIRRASPFVCLSGFLLFLYVVKRLVISSQINLCEHYLYYLGSFCYTAVNIPYGSMASVISSCPEDRASLSVFRSIGANIALLTISFIVPLLIYKNVDGKQIIIPEMFTIIMGVLMLIAFYLYQFCWRNSVERIQLPEKK